MDKLIVFAAAVDSHQLVELKCFCAFSVSVH